MGNREDLLTGAKRCLYEKGYARTTARDIAAASEVSLAAIGYHFGSKEALLNAALMQAIEDWSGEVARALAAEPGADAHAGPIERFEARWTRVIEAFAAHRPVWVATFEILVQSEHAPEVRQFLADAIQEGRLGLAALFEGIDAAVDEKQAQVVGSFYQALMSGVMVQWVVDPARAPSGHDLADALRMITANVEQGSAGKTAGATEGGAAEG